MKRFLAILTLAVLSAASAHAGHYRVELVVFRDLHPTNTPTPPLKPQAPDTSKAVDMDNATALRNTGIHLKSGGLAGIWKALRATADYHPMLRVSWTQPGRSRAGSVPLRVHDDKTYSIENVRSPQRKLYRLDGTANLIAQPYLHLRLNLFLIRPGTRKETTSQHSRQGASGQSPGAIGAPGLVAYHLLGSQAFQSGETHYFDNPAFGAIASVTKLQGGR